MTDRGSEGTMSEDLYVSYLDVFVILKKII